MSKRFARRFMSIALVFGLVIPGMVNASESDAAAAVSLSTKSVSLVAGKSVTLKVNAAKKVKIKKTVFTTKNTKVATVTAKGKVTGKKAGNTKITAKVTYTKGGKKLSSVLICKVSVANYKYTKYAKMSAEKITSALTLEQKAAQMLQPACYNLRDGQMKGKCYGSILSKAESLNAADWKTYVKLLQKEAVSSKAGVPFVYGQDDVHGVNYCSGATIFPHNIGLGAANDPELMYKMGQITADEAKLCNMLWNFSPCVAQSVDPRWGRTYESYGSDLNIIKSLSTQYVKGMLDNGLIACAKHFFGDGNVVYGTGEESDVQRIIDRGDARLSDTEIKELLGVYKTLIDAGVQTIMISHSAVNGVKMHENKKYIDILKNDYGFNGFIVSDWNSIQNISKKEYYDQVVTAINSGIDMLMEVDRFDEAIDAIVKAVNTGDITEARVDDAVTRILKVKLDAGIIGDPFGDKLTTKYKKTGSAEARKVAEQLVEKSLVLMKNDKNVLPLQKGQSIYITGPAADNDRAQCGGWTIDWNESPSKNIDGVTSIKEGFSQVAKSKGIKIVDDPKDADVVILCVGEMAYAEWNGDAEDLDVCKSKLALDGNDKAIEEAKTIGKPVVTCIVAGRNVFIGDYEKDWDGIVMCYLPGSEGQGVAKVLCGDAQFSGKLPSNWYSSVSGIEKKEPWRMVGEGLTY